ncbi:Protein VTS [Salix suchowensis]|nr:Protein VTS [Salix suchowensis]
MPSITSASPFSTAEHVYDSMMYGQMRAVGGPERANSSGQFLGYEAVQHTHTHKSVREYASETPRQVHSRLDVQDDSKAQLPFTTFPFHIFDMSLRPPSTSPSPSPGPDGIGNGRTIGSRQSVGPGASLRGTPTLAPSSPRPGGAPSARPTSELLGSAGMGMFQTPEAEALDQWFENLQSYEATLEDMAAASLDINFKEELSAIEQWFKVLSEAERTAALYSLLQHSTQAITRSRLSLGLKLPLSRFRCEFLAECAGRTSGCGGGYTSQQRAKLKASNAAHRISAPVLASTGGDARSTWGSQLGQVAEQSNSNGQDIIVGGTRPKSTEFSGTLGSPRASEGVGDSWASMVNTPLIPMFSKDTTRTQNLDAAASKLTEWSAAKTAAPVCRVWEILLSTSVQTSRAEERQRRIQPRPWRSRIRRQR